MSSRGSADGKIRRGRCQVGSMNEDVRRPGTFSLGGGGVHCAGGASGHVAWLQGASATASQ